MFDVHQDTVELNHSFDHAYERLQSSGPRDLQTNRGTPFTATATVVTKGKRVGERTIKFTRNGRETARAFSCCWGHYYNCYKTRIGMYCSSLDTEL